MGRNDLYPYVKNHYGHVLSRVRLFVTPWTVACQAPLPMGFSRQEYWSGLAFSSPEDLPDPGIEPGFLHCGQIVYHLSYEGSQTARIPVK